MEFFRLGDTTLLINFEQKINLEIHYKVSGFYYYLLQRQIEGIRFMIPAFASLTIGYDAERWNYEDLVERLKRFGGKEFQNQHHTDGALLEIPVCYEKQFGLDLDELEKTLSLSMEAIIQLHTSRIYDVYMLGFLPGFVYLGETDRNLFCQRKPEPRLKVSASAVGLAGNQTGIYPLDAPGGWQIIGRTPVRIFNPVWENPFLFKMGDRVRFAAIDEKTFRVLSDKILDRASLCKQK